MRSARDLIGSTSTTQNLVMLGGMGLVLYIAYNLIKGVKATVAGVGAVGKAAANAYTSAVNAVSSGLYTLFGPDDAAALGDSTYLLVSFPDGSRYAIGASQINPDGLFLWTGHPPGSQPAITLQLVKDNSGAWFATQDPNNTLLT